MKTPRTDAAWAKTFEDDDDQCRAGNAATDMRDECATLERELGALATERDQLRDEVERFKEWLADPHALHAHCLRTLSDAQIAHLFGERMTEIVNRAEKAEAELAAERARLDWLESDAGVDWQWSSSALTIRRAVIDAAMKEDAQ